MSNKQAQKDVEKAKQNVLAKQGKNVILPDDKNDKRMTRRTDYLHTVVSLAEFNTKSQMIKSLERRFRVTAGENLTQYQMGLVKISIKDDKGNPVSAIVHGDVLIASVRQALDPRRLEEKLEENKSKIIKPL